MLKYKLIDLIYFPVLVFKLYFQHSKIKSKVICQKYYYGSHKKQYIFITTPKEVKKNNIIFFTNGSGWTSTHIYLFKWISSFLGLFGYITVVASHRFVPKYTFPTQVEDIINGIKKTFEILGRRQLNLMGFSSGAQIVTLLSYSHTLEQHGLSKEMITGVVSISGPINFTECKNKRLVNLIGNYVSTLTNKDSADPYLHLVSETLKPILCIHGDVDPFVETENSISFINQVNELDQGKGMLMIEKNATHHQILRLFLLPNYSQALIKWLDEHEE